MDPATALALSGAVIAAIEKIIELHNAAKAGTITGAEALQRVTDMSSSLTTVEAADDAAAKAIEDARFPATEVTPIPEG